MHLRNIQPLAEKEGEPTRAGNSSNASWLFSLGASYVLFRSTSLHTGSSPARRSHKKQVLPTRCSGLLRDFLLPRNLAAILGEEAAILDAPPLRLQNLHLEHGPLKELLRSRVKGWLPAGLPKEPSPEGFHMLRWHQAISCTAGRARPHLERQDCSRTICRSGDGAERQSYWTTTVAPGIQQANEFYYL